MLKKKGLTVKVYLSCALPPLLSKVICTIVTLLLSIPGLDWGVQNEHVEVFCGKGEVTMAELQAMWRPKHVSKVQPSSYNTPNETTTVLF